jgi:hypothetical protein
MDYSPLDKLDAEIAELKQRIAERDAKKVPQPKTNVGWASYIMNDDPHLLDMYQNAERQWNQMQEQNKLTKELAAQNRQEQQMYAMDDNMKNRSLAAIRYNYAKQALENDVSNDPRVKNQLAQAMAEAKAELNYWNNRTGYEEVKDLPEKKEEKGTEEPTLSVKTVDYSGITSFGTEAEKQKILDEIEKNPAYNLDEKLRSEHVRLKGIKSKEQAAKEHKANLNAWYKEYTSLPGIPQSKWQKANPDKYKALQKAGLVK